MYLAAKTSQIMPPRILFVLLFAFSGLSAQNTQIYTHDIKLFKTAMELYHKQKYTAARHHFEKYLALGKNDLADVEAEFFLANCGLMLFHPDAEEKLNAFVKKHPEHALAQQAMLSLADFYRVKKEYKKAVAYYQSVDLDKLSDDQANEAQFNAGYCYLNDKDLTKALPCFNALKSTENKYTYAAAYYAGNIEYRQNDLTSAMTDLKKAQKNDSYKPLAPYMIANILYKQNKYDDLVVYTDSLEKSKTEFKNQEEISLLLSDVFFRKQEFLRCIYQTEKYKSAGKELGDDAAFRYAKSFYYTGKNEKAIEQFKKLTSRKDSIGQYSSYFLALTYLRDDNKAFALPLLSQASEITYSADLQEECLFLQGKVSYELGKLAEVISSLKSYRKKYPQGRFVQEANELLSDALLNTSNYAEALDYIRSLPKRTPKIDAVYQKVAFHRAEEVYNQNFYDSAIAYFQLSKQYAYDKTLNAAASFWMGEVKSMQRAYESAIGYYLESQENKADNVETFYKKADYGLGYAFFNLKQYEKAAQRLKTYTDRKDQQVEKCYPDALLRLADCCFALKRYNESLVIYEKAVQAHCKESDYILLQKGLINGTLGNYDQADNLLFALIHNYPKSPYYETALFNKAGFAIEKGDYKTAIEGFTMFIRERSGSTYVPLALERRAICNVNLGNTELAYNDYQTVLKEYPNSSVANAALQGVQEIMGKEGKNEEFLAILEEFKSSNPQKSDLENIEYETGKRLYFDQKYKEAIKTLENFLASYPNSTFSYDAHYYVADANYRLAKYAESLPYYQKVLDVNKGTYTNRSLFKLAEANYNLGQIPQAIQYYKSLLSVASSKKEVANAYQGLMLSFYQTANYDSAVFYGNLILNSGYATTTGANKAYLTLSKAYLQKADTLKAVDYLVSTVNEAPDENGAEAQYILANLFFAQQKYKSSLNELFNLNEYYSEYSNWVGKSFLLVSDNYCALKETFQARATLESIIKKFPDQQVVEQAKQKLEVIKASDKDAN
jgi:TolA-binding protein